MKQHEVPRTGYRTGYTLGRLWAVVWPCRKCGHNWMSHMRINACSTCLCDRWEA